MYVASARWNLPTSIILIGLNYEFSVLGPGPASGWGGGLSGSPWRARCGPGLRSARSGAQSRSRHPCAICPGPTARIPEGGGLACQDPTGRPVSSAPGTLWTQHGGRGAVVKKGLPAGNVFWDLATLGDGPGRQQPRGLKSGHLRAGGDLERSASSKLLFDNKNSTEYILKL